MQATPIQPPLCWNISEPHPALCLLPHCTLRTPIGDKHGLLIASGWILVGIASSKKNETQFMILCKRGPGQAGSFPCPIITEDESFKVGRFQLGIQETSEQEMRLFVGCLKGGPKVNSKKTTQSAAQKRRKKPARGSLTIKESPTVLPSVYRDSVLTRESKHDLHLRS